MPMGKALNDGLSFRRPLKRTDLDKYANKIFENDSFIHLEFDKPRMIIALLSTSPYGLNFNRLHVKWNILCT